jgi:predicted ester cyclase
VDVIVNQHDLSHLELIVTENCLSRPSEVQHIDGLRTIFEGTNADPGDHQVSDKQMFPVGNMVTVLATISGSCTGPFLDIPAIGRTFSVLLIELLRTESDKITERWGLLDTN